MMVLRHSRCSQHDHCRIISHFLVIFLSQILPTHATLVLDTVAHTDAGVTAILQSQTHATPCPACQVLSSHRHSHYRRTLQDLPWGRYAVQLQVILQKFRCRNAASPRRIFAEAINIILLGIFGATYIPTLTRYPDYFLTGYSLMIKLTSIGLFLLTGYCVCVLVKKPSVNNPPPELDIALFKNSVMQLEWIPLLQ